ncbi:MAG TPA: hypothetical protein VM370_01830 [Candidatus Thermoplasmatota archaeon]|nr:hypothetical protein [Candidatus Thermoplasmatota archaeon]
MPVARLFLALLAGAMLAGCGHVDPVWQTGFCGEGAAWQQPGVYDASPLKVQAPALQRTLEPYSRRPVLPYDDAPPFVLRVVHWNVDATITLERAESDGSIVLSVPTGSYPPEGREIDAFLALVSAAPDTERSEWRDALLANPTPTSWWTRLPHVELDGVAERFDALATRPREERRDGISREWAWTIPATQEGRYAGVSMDLYDERPLLEYAWTEDPAFVATVHPDDTITLRAPHLPGPANVTAAFARMGFPEPPLGERWVATPAPPTGGPMPTQTPPTRPYLTPALCPSV